MNLRKLAHLAAAGALMLSVSALDGFQGTEVASAREALAPRPELNSGITIQNLSANAATVSLAFVNSLGSSVLTYQIPSTIPAFSQYTLVTDQLSGLPDGFSGSVVVDSDQLVAATVNLQGASGSGGSDSDPFRLTTYTGFASTDTAQTLYVPQVMRYSSGGDNWNSIVAVQNASTVDAVVTISYRDRSGNAVAATSADTTTIKGNSSYNFKQADRTELASSFIGSAVISTTTSGASLAAITTITNGFNDGSHSQFLAYNASARGGTKLYAPRLSNSYYGYSSGLTIQNTTGTTANVTISWSFPNNTIAPTTLTISPYAASALYLPALGTLPTGARDGKGSAIITSDQNIVAIVNEDNRETAGYIGRGDTYNAFVEGNQTKTVYLPQVTALSYGYASGITVLNASTSDGTGTITLTNRDGTTKTLSISILAGKSQVFFAPNIWGTDANGNYNLNLNGSATVTFSQPIFVIHDMSCRGDIDSRCGANYGDSFTMYNGINQ